MAIRFLTGMPRNGKSYSATKLILTELCKDDGRHVVTNVPLRLGAIYVYLRRRGKESHFARLVLLEGHTKPKEFFKYVPGRKFHVDSVGNLTVVEQGMAAVCVVDEANVFWPARGYQATTNTFLTYMQQHGHMGDDVWLVCHNAGQVDKQLRYLAQEYWVSVNLGMRRLWGLRGPKGKFVIRVYQSEPSPTAKPIETVPYTLNEEVSGCYDTAAGVGISAGIADQEKDLRGRTPLWAIPAALACIGVVMFFLWGGPRVLSFGLGKYFSTAKPDVTVETNSPFTLTKTVLPTETNQTLLVQTRQLTRQPEIPAPAPDDYPAARERVTVSQPVQSQPVLVPQQSVLANPTATDSGWRTVVIYGFDGKVHAVRRYRLPSESNTLRLLSSPPGSQINEETENPRFPSGSQFLNQ